MKCDHRQGKIQRRTFQPEVPQDPVGSNDDRRGVEQRQRLQGFLRYLVADAEHVFGQPQPDCRNGVVQRRMVELPVIPWVEIRQTVMLQQIRDIAGMIVLISETPHIVLPPGNGRVAHVEKPEEKAAAN